MDGPQQDTSARLRVTVHDYLSVGRGRCRSDAKVYAECLSDTAASTGSKSEPCRRYGV